jgi:4-hydroxy-3-polyprenylbenzoate decarboxylase
MLEGPLGEWTGYYSGDARQEPAIRIATMMHRDNPILMGAIPAVPPNDNTFYLGAYRCGAIWNQLEAAGIPEVRGVWALEAGGSRFWTTVSIKQLYGGHAKQAGMVAAHCLAGAYCNRWTIVVDDDIDPTNIDDVIWAMCSRVDTREDIDIIEGGWSSALDPMCYDGDDDRRNGRIVINACRPWKRKDTFPIIARSSKALDERIRAKWAHALP